MCKDNNQIKDYKTIWMNIGFTYFAEWWVKVVGKQSCIGFDRKIGVRSLRVAPFGSDLSPYWLIIDEDGRK